MMSKVLFLVNPVSHEIRRQSDEAELNIVLRSEYRRANPTPPESHGENPDARHAAHAIGTIKMASPEVCRLTEFTSVCYREPPIEECPRSGDDKSTP